MRFFLRAPSLLAFAGVTFALTSYTTRAAAQQGNRALIYCPNSAGVCSEGFTQLTSALTNAGAAGVDQNTALPALTDYRLIFVVVPTSPLPAPSLTSLVSFHGAGGTVVGVAESSGYAGSTNANLNGLSNALGFGDMFNTTTFDSGCPQTGTVTPGHPLMNGVSTFAYAWSSSVSGGTLLVTGASGQAIVRAQDGFVASADSSMFTDVCGTSSYAANGNLQFFANLWTTADSDTDDDGVPDDTDNCVSIANPGQEDNDMDGAGDVCDDDDDNDAVLDVDDNCVLVANAGQEDNDMDDIGDVCDDDDDNDAVLDVDDNCALIANAGQEDNDVDDIGDVCDDDDDNDGILDGVDPCPFDPDPQCGVGQGGGGGGTGGSGQGGSGQGGGGTGGSGQGGSGEGGAGASGPGAGGSGDGGAPDGAGGSTGSGATDDGTDDGGCNCRSAGTTSANGSALALVGLALGLFRRRARRAARG